MKARAGAIFLAVVLVALPAAILSSDMTRWAAFLWHGYSGDGTLTTRESGRYPKYAIRLPVMECTLSSSLLYPVSRFSTNVSTQISGNHQLRGVPPCEMRVGIDIVDAKSNEQISGFSEVATILLQTEGKLALEIVDSKGHLICECGGSLPDWKFAQSAVRFYMFQPSNEPLVFDPLEVYSIKVVGSLPNAILNEIRLQLFLEGGGYEVP